MARGALGCSISGAGPTMFAWAEEVKAEDVRAAMVDAFRAEGITSDAWITRIEPVGAPRSSRASMRFVSTRGGAAPVTLERRDPAGHRRRTAGCSSPSVCRRSRGRTSPPAPRFRRLPRGCSRPFADGDRARGRARAPSARRRSTSPRRSCGLRAARAAGADVLELFHGPTCAFKDFGARFLAAALERLHGLARAQGDHPRRHVRRHGRRGRRGVPPPAVGRRRPALSATGSSRRGRRSSSHAGATTCGPSRSAARSTTASAWSRRRSRIPRWPPRTASRRQTASTSGRLLPQMVYYAAASLEIWHREGRKANFIVPSGNLGNVTACVWAREAGLPIGDIVLATNENRTVTEFLDTGAWRPRAERRDAGLGDGRRQPVEHGAAARALSGGARRARDRAPGHRRADPGDHPAGCRDARLHLGSARRDRGASVYHHLPDGSPARSRGCWLRRRIRRSSTRSWSRSSAATSRCRRRCARLLSLPRQEQSLEPTLEALRGHLAPAT